MVSSSSSRLTKRNTRKVQKDLNEFLQEFTPLPQQASLLKAESSSAPPKPLENNILNGVVACLDVRTEDGDDVSVNFERALHSLGAKTRRTLSDSVTHFIFKNGSPAILKKALKKKVFIINLLWISRCKQEGKRWPEKEFLIEKPQRLILEGKKRRKSMEPSKVKALDKISTTTTTTTTSTTTTSFMSQSTLSLTIKTKELKNSLSEREMRKRHIEEAEEEDRVLDSKLSSPHEASVANKHDDPVQTTLPINAPDTKVQEQIKARFSIGQTPVEHNNTAATSALLMRKKRKLTRDSSRPSTVSSKETCLSNKPKHHTIVLTCMPISVRKQCEDIIKRLGHFQIEKKVTENTTHVLVGSKRRTNTVMLGLLKGAWILSPEWLLQSANKNEYMQEQNFELLNWYPRADLARHGLKIFPASIGISVYSTSHGVEFVKELVTLTGATLVERHEDADIIICTKNDTPSITEKNRIADNWLFKSIEEWRYLPIDEFALKN